VFVTLDDGTGLVECVAWPRLYPAAARALAAGWLFEVIGRVQETHGAVTLELEAIQAHPKGLRR
ncbi:MAG: hypothetical protein GF355_11325, partial [Candidatus Eisenbacteria bacterium]|nr:hypothetical protein [Candidatus Eisenbacteria bacterium]